MTETGHQWPPASLASPTDRVACPLCGCQDSRVVLEAPGYASGVGARFPLSRCQECRFVFSNPRVPPDDIWAYYGDGYFGETAEPDLQAMVAAEAQFGGLMRRLGRTVGRLLDYGAGAGALVAAASRLGWEAAAVEPVASFRDRIRALAPAALVCADLDEVRHACGDTRFDVVNMTNVLEHLPDPVAVLRDIRTIMKPDGDLVVAVPSIATWEFPVFGASCYVLQVPLHYSQFTPTHLKAALERAGYRCARVEHLPVTYVRQSGALRRGEPVFAIQRAAAGVAHEPYRPTGWRIPMAVVTRLIRFSNVLARRSPSIRAFARPGK
jgi:SAM-dependent methyltransferase